MRSLRGVGVLFSLLIGGVLGGLMAPLPSAAAPTLTIDGVAVGLTQITCADTGYNSCWSLNGTSPRTFGVWKVGDASGTNKARVLMNDVSTAGSVDSMKLTGATFTPVVAAGTKVTNAILTNTYNQVTGGNPAGDYSWSMAQGGYFDPLSTENVVGNRLKLTGTGTASGVTFPLGVLDTGILTSPTVLNLIGYVTKSKAASVVKPACNTGSNRCAPTIKYDYEITVVGLDTLYLTDSVFGCGGTCRGAGAGDDAEEGGGAELPLCSDFAVTCNAPTEVAVAAIVTSGTAAGGVEACGGGNCIVTVIKATPAKRGAGVTFNFDATGPGVANFSIKVAATGLGYHTSKDLATGPTVGTRTFSIPSYPVGWQTDQISCVSLLNNNTLTYTVDGSSVKGPLHVLTLGAGDTVTCTWHMHRD